MQYIDEILRQMATPQSLKKRDFRAGGRNAAIVFNPDIINPDIIGEVVFALERNKGKTLKQLAESVVYAAEITLKQGGDVLPDVLSGDSVVEIEGLEGLIIIATRKWDKRAVAEPPTETVMRGPREGFIEDLKTNMSLLARRLKTPDFAAEKLKIGRLTKTNVALCYISSVAQPELIDRIRQKLSNIDVDGIIDSHYLLPHLETHPNSIFHQIGVSEKPDVVAAKMLEGRIAIIVDGSPMVLTAPFLFVEDFQSGEDYYERNIYASFLRIMRYISAFFAVFLPGFFAALQIFHFNVIPVTFLITVMNAVKGIPFSPLPEVLIVLLLFEIIREASVRMPRSVGMAMSIVGAIVLGETAVKAGMISSPTVMVVAVSSIALYTIPNEVGTFSILRVCFTLFGGLLGFYALIIGLLFLAHYLVSLDSLGSPYMAPFAPLVFDDMGDAVVRRQFNKLKKRPKSIPNINETRRA